MRTYDATLLHVTVSRSGTYHEGANVQKHQAQTCVIDDERFTTLTCIPSCERSFKVRARRQRELGLLRFRRFVLGAGLMLLGSVAAAAGGGTGSQFFIALGALSALVFYVAGAILWGRMFIASNRYVLTDEAGQMLRGGEHRIVLKV